MCSRHAWGSRLGACGEHARRSVNVLSTGPRELLHGNLEAPKERWRVSIHGILGPHDDRFPRGIYSGL